MGNVIDLIMQIFMLKEDNSTKVGLSEFKDNNSSIKSIQKPSGVKPKALKLSELMRKSY